MAFLSEAQLEAALLDQLGQLGFTEMQTWALAYQARNTLGTTFAILLVKKESESQRYMNTNGQRDFSEASDSKGRLGSGA